MKHRILIQSVAVGVAYLAVPGSVAQIRAGSEAPQDPKSRFLFSYQAGLNLKVTFSNLGGLEVTPPQLARSGTTGNPVDRTYMDGYNRVDIRGNADGLTWNWGYDSDSQVVGGGAALAMHAYASAPTGSLPSDTGDPQHGFEIIYQRLLTENDRGKAGVELAFNYTRLDVRNTSTLLGSATRITDTFALGGVIPPLAPYGGTFGGPGALISDLPTRTTVELPGASTIAGSREVEGHALAFKLGLYVEKPLSRSISLLLHGGGLVGIIDEGFTFNEAVSVPGLPAVTRRGSASEDSVVGGAYAGGMLLVRLSDSVGVFGGAQWQLLGKETLRAGGKEARIDLGDGIYVHGGVSWSF